MAREEAEFARDLGRQFARRLDHEHRRPRHLLTMETVDQRNQECGGLTTAGFGGGDDVAPTLDQWNRARLDGRSFMMATVTNGTMDFG